jgi:hypothetical protein
MSNKIRNRQKIPDCGNNSKIKYQNRRKRQNRYPYANTLPITCLGTGTSIKSGVVKLVFFSKGIKFKDRSKDYFKYMNYMYIY